MTGRTARRLLGAVIVALLFGGFSGTAMADTLWERSEAQAGRDGASLKITRAYAGDDGTVFFEELHYTAGPDGANAYRTVSGAGRSRGAEPAASGARKPAGAAKVQEPEPIPLRARKAGTQKTGAPRR
ncbi:hypothetical protein GCM10010156_24750 [Planobispora rosea]|uniref:Uncharacterized protein n=1 Tax=Planobispora rosea TaxID=35762 RepID=A0A8J3RXE0_PLARO|nr:hypothetical protein [Planobispora rosea]GGS64884.1 hypothetical protein GCM10010156_24750 [Planobispora rosea]GIH84836.1 hypothetical protein Pro02_32440 [Planobispora rosea]